MYRVFVDVISRISVARALLHTHEVAKMPYAPLMLTSGHGEPLSRGQPLLGGDLLISRGLLLIEA